MKRIGLTVAGVVGLGFLGLFLVAWSGVYSVSAAAGHWSITRWFLTFGLRSSVELHSLGTEAPDLTRSALVERGAGHFQTGCAPCHGAPGIARNEIVLQMLPPPPDLTRLVPSWSAGELHWIVKNGIKYTGMPAWPAQVRDDEVWAMVAFLRQLPRMAPAEYARLALGTATPAHISAREIASVGFARAGPLACARCHGANGEGGEAGGIPRLAGQRPGYLLAALRAYAYGTRPSGIMQPIATYLSETDMRQLANYYASLDSHGQKRSIPHFEPALLRRGEQIAEKGIPEQRVAPCASCHGSRGRARAMFPLFPGLAGQHFDYLQYQLKLWRAGVRGGPLAEIMRSAVQSITDEQIAAVSAYYASAP